MMESLSGINQIKLEKDKKMKIKIKTRKKVFEYDFANGNVIFLTGPSGSGKSYIEHSIIKQVLKDLDFKLIIIDCKRVEFGETKRMLELSGDRLIDIDECDLWEKDGWEKLDEEMHNQWKLFIIIDEFSDLVCKWPSEFESFIEKVAKSRLEQFLVISTSSPRTEVVTKIVKQNISKTIKLELVE